MWRRFLIGISIVLFIVVGYSIVNVIEPGYAEIPSVKQTLNHPIKHQMNDITGYDIWGLALSEEEAGKLHEKDLTLHNGAVKIDESFINEGRKLFFNETFNNEEYITDVLGVLDGPLSVGNIAKAVLSARKEGTDNLKVEIAKDAVVGGRHFKKGEMIETGLDVPKGGFAPLGMPIKFKDGRLKAGITCAACHATVDRDLGLVIEGAPNANFDAGLLLALASNSTAYFTNTAVDADKLKAYIEEEEWMKEKESKGEYIALPNVEKMEEAVDRDLLTWSKGNFDSTMDLVNNPSQIPDSFTLGDHPYGWNGFASVGSFKGLTALNNNVHAQNSDLLAQADQSEALFEIDKERYIGTILQNAANPEFRYHHQREKGPADWLSQIDDNDTVPGFNDMIRPPTYPNVSLFTPNGTVIGSEGHTVLEELNAISAYQNALKPPLENESSYSATERKGREVFTKAGCITCHAGEARTNHLIIPVEELRTEPSRALAFKDAQSLTMEPWFYPLDTPIPVPEDVEKIKIPTNHLDKKQVELSLAYHSNGGYKVKGLVGLKYSAPYLHEGGVSIGTDVSTQIGLAGTFEKGIEPDPYNSLLAMIDRELREKVVTANKQSRKLQASHSTGEGHMYWVDQKSGFSKEEQDALIQYLLSIDLDKERKIDVDDK
ncbi:electron transport protein [Halalkalibacter krulwichiae]|uniref:Cytochrome c n=1 Tax=Halalkalibacter krulwichiae TaxID=199441 RepID=A0A1X9MHW5_9BACI|nr:electron transport protein [Halalkalibacter krulwichiae]ARK31181.1 Cytochrome c [Halalkalibacter krulwichiae]